MFLEGVVKEEMKNLFSRFANDAIATAAFGIEVDSLNDPENEFYLMGKDYTDVAGGFRWIKITISAISPALLKVYILLSCAILVCGGSLRQIERFEKF